METLMIVAPGTEGNRLCAKHCIHYLEHIKLETWQGDGEKALETPSADHTHSGGE